MQPIIGITSSFTISHESDPPRENTYVNAVYCDAIWAGGGIPHVLPVPPRASPDVLDALLQGVDGLLFTGGDDLDPTHYGQPKHAKSELMHPRRGAFEVEFFRRADAARVPIMTICLGYQVAHVARGGQLIQHVDDLAAQPGIAHHLPRGKSAFHRVRIAPDSALARVVAATDIEVNSRHHQAVDAQRQGRGLRPVAYAPDGLLEASEDMDGRFLLAVQWHPENLIDRPEHLCLFQTLVQAARNHRA